MEKRGKAENLTNAGKGRPLGSKNKFSSMKESVLKVYQDIGGDKAFAEWAKRRENQGRFYEIAAKMIPKEVEVAGKGGGPLEVNIISYKDAN